MSKKKQGNSASEDLSPSHTWTRKSVLLLLELYYERLDRFRDQRIMKKILWLEMLEEMHLAGYRGLTWKGLDRKMRNLKTHYFKVQKHKGANSSWEYYGILSSIYGELSGAEITSVVQVKTEINSADEICAGTPPDTEEFCDDFTQEDSTHEPIYFSDAAHSGCPESSEDQIAATPSPAYRGIKKKRTRAATSHNISFELMLQKIDESNRIQRVRNKILKQILFKLK